MWQPGWLALSPRSKEAPRSNMASVFRLRVLHTSAWVLRLETQVFFHPVCLQRHAVWTKTWNTRSPGVKEVKHTVNTSVEFPQICDYYGSRSFPSLWFSEFQPRILTVNPFPSLGSWSSGINSNQRNYLCPQKQQCKTKKIQNKSALKNSGNASSPPLPVMSERHTSQMRTNQAEH